MNSIGKKLQICFVSATPLLLINTLSEAGVVLLDMHSVDLLTMEILVYNHQRELTIDILEKFQAEIKSIKQFGILWILGNLFKRPILISGIALLVLISIFASDRIFLVKVSGNQKIPSAMILEEAELCGIRFGQKIKVVRSEDVKNQLLQKFPQLQWVGITTSGCIANIKIQERIQPEIELDFPGGISNVVALRDGTITEMTVERGTALASVGQVVRKGDIIVSGYSDLGLKVIAENALAEIMAFTTRRNIFITPAPTYRKDSVTKKHSKFRLRIGKKVINFCNHSGIPDEVCVKMYSEDYWTLPGGVILPVSLTRIDCWHYPVTDQTGEMDDMTDWLLLYAKRYLQSQMVGGQILEEDYQWQHTNEYFQLEGIYACHEMIGQVKYEEITEQNAKDY